MVRYPGAGRPSARDPVARRQTGPRPARLGLEQTERLRIPLSTERDTTLELTAPVNFPLAAPDTRARAFRIVNIDFE